jgi:DNA-binding PadR family transcriptional regulator
MTGGRGNRKLGATAYAALVMLAFGEASGYELKRRADNTLRFFFAAPAMSQLYAELARLTEIGLVVDRLERRGGERETRVFALTPAGHDELRRWLADDGVPVTVFKSHLALRLIVGHLAEPARMLADVRAERERAWAERSALQAVVDGLAPDDPVYGWARTVGTWGLRYFDDTMDQLDELCRAIEEKAVNPAAG